VDPSAPDVSEDPVEFSIADITFKTDGPVYDTEETIKALEKAVLMASETSHDPTVFFLDSDEVVSFSHYTTSATDEGGRKLYTLDLTNFWYYYNSYRTNTSCQGCRRRLSAGIQQDDAESHAQWEANLCEILNGIPGYQGASECVITLVESA